MSLMRSIAFGILTRNVIYVFSVGIQVDVASSDVVGSTVIEGFVVPSASQSFLFIFQKSLIFFPHFSFVLAVPLLLHLLLRLVEGVPSLGRCPLILINSVF